MLAELVGKLLCVALSQPEPAEEILRAFLVRELDPNPPVVVCHSGSLLSRGSRHRFVPVPGTGTFFGTPRALRRCRLLRRTRHVDVPVPGTGTCPPRRGP